MKHLFIVRFLCGGLLSNVTAIVSGFTLSCVCSCTCVLMHEGFLHVCQAHAAQTASCLWQVTVCCEFSPRRQHLRMRVNCLAVWIGDLSYDHRVWSNLACYIFFHNNWRTVCVPPPHRFVSLQYNNNVNGRALTSVPYWMSASYINKRVLKTYCDILLALFGDKIEDVLAPLLS